MKSIYTYYNHLYLVLGIIGLTTITVLNATEPDEKPSHQYPYIGCTIGNTTPTSLLLGYRWIQDGIGIDMNATAHYFRPIGNLKTFSFSPSALFYLNENYYTGLGVCLSYSHINGNGFSADETYTYAPHILIGKEFTCLDGKKGFTHIHYAPIVYSDAEYFDGRMHKVEFRVGIGF